MSDVGKIQVMCLNVSFTFIQYFFLPGPFLRDWAVQVLKQVVWVDPIVLATLIIHTDAKHMQYCYLFTSSTFFPNVSVCWHCNSRKMCEQIPLKFRISKILPSWVFDSLSLPVFWIGGFQLRLFQSKCHWHCQKSNAQIATVTSHE